MSESVAATKTSPVAETASVPATAQNTAATAGAEPAAATTGTEATAIEVDDPELEAMKQRVKEMEEEAAKLREMQAQVEKEMNLGAESIESKELVDSRSIYVGNVDYSSTPEELQSHFQACGTINRVTILCDRWGNPKGYAYVEFTEPDHVANAMAMNESLFKGRLIKVTAKRTNVPGMTRGRGRGRGRGGRRGRGGYRSRRAYYSPY